METNFRPNCGGVASRRFEAFAGSDLVEDRSNPEMHDMDGWPTKFIYFACAENPYGQSFRHCYRFDTEEEAVALADRVNAHLKSNPDWKPGEHWYPSFAVYGSECYVKEGGESELARLDVESEFGPGSYRPSSPGYIG
jgi:hypothetical protein